MNWMARLLVRKYKTCSVPVSRISEVSKFSRQIFAPTPFPRLRIAFFESVTICNVLSSFPRNSEKFRKMLFSSAIPFAKELHRVYINKFNLNLRGKFGEWQGGLPASGGTALFEKRDLGQVHGNQFVMPVLQLFHKFGNVKNHFRAFTIERYRKKWTDGE